MLLTALRPLSSAKTTVSYITVSTGWTLTSLTRMRVGGCHRHCAHEVLLALFPDLHAQLFSLATKAGHGGLGMRRRYFPNRAMQPKERCPVLHFHRKELSQAHEILNLRSRKRGRLWSGSGALKLHTPRIYRNTFLTIFFLLLHLVWIQMTLELYR